jgi:ERI1 exoribonuclease 2
VAWCDLRRDFSHFVVVDFEATCEKDSRIYPQEIIEFPAVLVDAATGRLLSAFRTYVRSRHYPRLTAFCTELTGIRQDQADGGVELSEALAKHDQWLAAAGAVKDRLAVVTWGDWDCKAMLEFECRFKDIAKPAYFDRWVNLRVPFEAAFGPGRRNLQEASLGVGRLHCGLDDARNTAYLLVELMRRGVTISITGSLTPALAPKEEDERPPQQQPPQPQLQPQAGGHNFSMWHGGCAAGTVPCFCYCGVAIMRGVVMAPGPMQGRCFYGCGNCTVAFGPMCPFFSWAA